MSSNLYKKNVTLKAVFYFFCNININFKFKYADSVYFNINFKFYLKNKRLFKKYSNLCRIKNVALNQKYTLKNVTC